MPIPKIHEDIARGYTPSTGDSEADSKALEHCIEIIQKNLDEGEYEDLNVRYDGQTPLQSLLASHTPDFFQYELKITKMLLEHPEVKEQVNAIGGHGGYTALRSTALTGKVEMAKLLIESGADTEIKDDKGKTPADIIREGDRDGNFQEFEKALRYPKNANWDAAIQEQNEFLRKHREFKEARIQRNIHEDIFKGSSGDDAHRERWLKTIRNNLDSGAYKDLNVLYSQNTPLMSVATSFNPDLLYYKLEIAKMLLERREVKEQVNTQEEGTGITALHSAAIAGKVKIAKLLIENGADTNIKSYGDMTAADWVHERNERDTQSFPEFEAALRDPENANWDAVIQEQNEEVKRFQELLKAENAKGMQAKKQKP